MKQHNEQLRSGCWSHNSSLYSTCADGRGHRIWTSLCCSRFRFLVHRLWRGLRQSGRSAREVRADDRRISPYSYPRASVKLFCFSHTRRLCIALVFSLFPSSSFFFPSAVLSMDKSTFQRELGKYKVNHQLLRSCQSLESQPAPNLVCRLFASRTTADLVRR